MAANKKQAFKGQYDGEEVLLVFRKHPVVMRRGLIGFMLAILLGTIPSFIWVDFAVFYGGLAAGLLLGIIIMLPSWVYWYFSVYIMTNQRFIQITQKGFFHRSVSDTGINHIQSVNFQIAGIQETLLGFGSVLIQTYLGDIMIHDIHKPEEVTNTMFGFLREYGDVIKTDEVDPKKVTNRQYDN